MCGRYYIDGENPADEMRQIIDVLNRRETDVKSAGEICPGDTVPVLANSPSLQINPYPMHWGYTLSDGRLLFNARSETAASKPIFQDGMAQRRCLIPATCYFEWEHRGKDKIKYAIGDPKSPILYLAGIYRKEGRRVSCTILTCEPADQIAFIHNRMPVILPADAIKDWLNIRYNATEILKSADLSVAYQMAE